MDTASRERYQSLTAQYYRGAHVVLLVCSLDSEYTLTRLAKWHQEAQYYVDESEVIYALVATKSDLEEVEREVSREMLLGFSSHYGVEEARVFEISSKTGEGVDDMLQTLAETVVEQFERGSTSLNIRSEFYNYTVYYKNDFTLIASLYVHEYRFYHHIRVI